MAIHIISYEDVLGGMNYFEKLLVVVGCVDPNVTTIMNVFRSNGGAIPIHVPRLALSFGAHDWRSFVKSRLPVLIIFLWKRAAAIVLTSM